MIWEGAAAIVSILIVTLTLWLLVRRVGNARAERKRKKATQDPAYVETVSLGSRS